MFHQSAYHECLGSTSAVPGKVWRARSDDVEVLFNVLTSPRHFHCRLLDQMPTPEDLPPGRGGMEWGFVDERIRTVGGYVDENC